MIKLEFLMIINSIPGGDKEFRRVLLRHSDIKHGAFSPLFGKSEIELIQVLNRKSRDIYEGRIWGDPGFIHLCFDINDMDTLREKAKHLGFTFTVDSAKAMDSFDMVMQEEILPIFKHRRDLN